MRVFLYVRECIVVCVCVYLCVCVCVSVAVLAQAELALKSCCPNQLRFRRHRSARAHALRSSAMPAAAKAASSDDAQPAVPLSLGELNQRSAGLGAWDVGSFHPELKKYTYAAKDGTGQKAGATFRVILVSVADPSLYVDAHLTMRSGNIDPLKRAEEKFSENRKFRISKVALDTAAKQEYLHAPVKLRIDLGKTLANPLMQQKEDEVIHPEPAMSINDCKKLQQTQRFDVTALLDEVSDVRSVTDSRQLVSVKILDDSGDDGRPAELSFFYFMHLPLTIHFDHSFGAAASVNTMHCVLVLFWLGTITKTHYMHRLRLSV